MRKLPCPPAAGSASDHFCDADYKTKDWTDGEHQDVILGQRHRSILDLFFSHMTMHLQTILRQGNVIYQKAERCVGSDEPKPG